MGTQVSIYVLNELDRVKVNANITKINHVHMIMLLTRVQ